MKKTTFFIALIFASAITFGQSLNPRFGTPPKGDNTGQSVTFSYSTPDTVSSVALVPNTSWTFVNPKPLVKTMTITASVKTAHVADVMVFTFKGAGYANGGSAGSDSVLWSTGFEQHTANITVDSTKIATAMYVFNGSKWVQLNQLKE